MKFKNNKDLFLPRAHDLFGPAPLLAAPNDDAWYILTLMRHESQKLGFIPIQAILQRIKAYDAVIWQHDKQNRRIGYLIHSRPEQAKPLRVHLTVIDIDHRRRYWATQAVAKLIKKAHEADCSEIRLRCAHDLEANFFWRSLGFLEISRHPNMGSNPRDIITYVLPKQNFNQIRTPTLIPVPKLATTHSPLPERRPALLPATRPLTRPLAGGGPRWEPGRGYGLHGGRHEPFRP